MSNRLNDGLAATGNCAPSKTFHLDISNRNDMDTKPVETPIAIPNGIVESPPDAPLSPLGVKLAEIRENAIAAGMPLLTDEQLDEFTEWVKGGDADVH
jgi:hypothetical protein